MPTCCDTRSDDRLRLFPLVDVGMPADYGEHNKKSNDIGDRHVPAVPEPEADRLCFRILVRQRYPGRRTEPYHRAAKTDCVREVAPIVAALLKGQGS